MRKSAAEYRKELERVISEAAASGDWYEGVLRKYEEEMQTKIALLETLEFLEKFGLVSRRGRGE